MERLHESQIPKFVNRRLTGVRTAIRLLRHELELAPPEGRSLSIERHTLEDALISLELFVEDFEAAMGSGVQVPERRETNGGPKPAAARLK